jgi:hypothetical protein
MCVRISPGITPAAAALPLLSMLVTAQLDPLCIKCRPTSKRGSAIAVRTQDSLRAKQMTDKSYPVAIEPIDVML